MGNQQSEKTTESGEDTPDEHKSRCCEIPKKKGKDRNTKHRGSSRSEDNDFSPEEIYPFEDQSVIEKTASDPVDLDPFEIVETEDIDYMPGASSKDVIVSTSEGKFKISKESENIVKLTERQDSGGGQKIALEDYFPRHSAEIIEDNKVSKDLQQNHGRQEIFLENYFPRHSCEIVDSSELMPDVKQNNTWDASASNFFANAQIQNEKRESKSQKSGKDKSKKDKRTNKVDVVVVGDQPRYYVSHDQNQATVETAEEKPVEFEDDENCETNQCESQTEGKKTTAETGQKTELNKKQNIAGQLVENSGGVTDNNTMITDTKSMSIEQPLNNDSITTPDGNREEHFYDVLDPAYKLYDTINRKQSETEDSNKLVGEHMYENVKEITEVTDQQSEVVKPPHGFGDSTGDDSVYNISSLDTTTLTDGDFEESLEDISLSREMIVKDSTESESIEPAMPNVENENNLTSKTGVRESVSTTATETASGMQECRDTGVKLDTAKLQTVASTEDMTTPKCESRDEENVPPPTPATMDTLHEEEDDEAKEENNVNRKSIGEGVEQFGDIVCKRLSLLLEGKLFENESEGEVINDVNEEQVVKTDHLNEEFCAFVENIDATSTGVLKPKLSDKAIADSINFQENVQNLSASQESQTETQNNNETSDQLNNNKNLDVPSRSNSAETLKRISGDSVSYGTVEGNESSDDDGLPDYFQPEENKPKRDSEILCEVLDAYTDANIVAVPAEKVSELTKEYIVETSETLEKSMNLKLKQSTEQLLTNPQSCTDVDELQDITPTAEVNTQLTALTELAKADDGTPIQYEGRHSIPCTESDLDISEQRDDMSTDSMLADDEAEETMEILFTKTYTEPVQGAEVFLSCTVVNSAYKNEQRHAEQWLSDDALEYLEANASDIMSTAFMKAKKEMKDIQTCLQSLRKQMEHFHTNVDDVRVPDTAMDSLSADYLGLPWKAATD